MAADHHDVLGQHGYHRLRVAKVIDETDDAKSFVFDVPDSLRSVFAYEAGQFCTFRVRVDGDALLRCYSMSSAPEMGDELTVTVKRVPGGAVSNWFNDAVAEGDHLELTRPAGVFCLQPADEPVVAFCGGSGVTPVLSIVKAALAGTPREAKVLYANRRRDSVIFDDELMRLVGRHPDRLVLQHHIDADAGYLDADDVVRFVDGRLDAQFYVCGPGPFMDLVEATLLGLGVRPERIHIERFAVPEANPTAATITDTTTVTITLGGKTETVEHHAGDTVLQAARRAGLRPPFSCESGSCATCMAHLDEGTVTMRVNNALTPDEVDEGWILTCQSLPTSSVVRVEYESF